MSYCSPGKGDYFHGLSFAANQWIEFEQAIIDWQKHDTPSKYFLGGRGWLLLAVLINIKQHERHTYPDKAY